ncbi:MAG TPA: 16S rRNA (cytidine(1402)-2'-O)-methyltransferase [Gammaproteobacteria bacterium]|nr:16S rRNA (cytidine(1402)-2'-O)-methyltransferase [Gammaproteobacteria bacterium]
MISAGTLYVVATPIGNLDDISRRAIDTLQGVDLIAAEDTRHSKALLEKIEVKTRLTSYHDFSDDSVAARFLDKLQQGQSIALISDAGTPLISDPGFKLVRLVREANIPVIPIPGVSAITAALSVAGLATDRFCFEGFLASKQGAREQSLSQLKYELRTMVFYESPHRIEAMLASVVVVFGESRQVFVGRELTKKFESHFLGSSSDVLAWLQADSNNQRGEFVVIVAGCDKDAQQSQKQEVGLRLALQLESEMSLKKAVALASDVTGARKNLLYAAMIEIKNSSGDA